MLRLGDTVIELFIRPNAPQRATEPEALGLRHLAFRVTDITAARDWLNAVELKQSQSTRTPPTAGTMSSSVTRTVSPWNYTIKE